VRVLGRLPFAKSVREREDFTTKTWRRSSFRVFLAHLPWARV
jgi:hypothetical protein